MNLELLDPFARKQYPELLETYVYEPGSFATLTRFNRRGTLLASGCHNGKIVIWDFMTRSKAATMHRVSRGLSFVTFAHVLLTSAPALASSHVPLVEPGQPEAAVVGAGLAREPVERGDERAGGVA